MEKRAIAAILLSVVVLFLFRYLADRQMGDVQKRKAAPGVISAKDSRGRAGNVLPEASAPVEGGSPAPFVPALGDTAVAAQKVVIEGGLYRAVLDSQGALLTSWELNSFKTARGQTFEMIAANYFPETRPYPGSIILDDVSLTKRANWEQYELDVLGGQGAGGTLSPPATVVARLRRGDLVIEKRFEFEKDNYLVDLSVTVAQNGKPLGGKIFLGEDIGPELEHLLNPSVQLVAVSDRDGKVHRDEGAKDENEIKRLDGSVRWVGIEMQYFAIIAVPTHPLSAFEIQKRTVKTEGLDQKEITRNLLRLTVPLTGTGSFAVYLGPKQQSYLEAIKGADLSGVINYGTFSILVRPLLFSLKWIDRYVHNYGVAIMLLTLLLTLLLFPFRLKQMLSMKKMAVVQPKVKEIQERYKRYKKTDPRRAEMNKEVMQLYKEHNVNPLGGCLPLILQMPLLFAFYSLLAASIELRQAPFFAWIHDLSMKDPYYILPIVMGVTMLISQRMTPMAPGTDPAQAKMMMVMPVVFTIMFLNVSSGLNLYFLCSNIFQIGFQKIAERWMGDSGVAVKV